MPFWVGVNSVSENLQMELIEVQQWNETNFCFFKNEFIQYLYYIQEIFQPKIFCTTSFKYYYWIHIYLWNMFFEDEIYKEFITCFINLCQFRKPAKMCNVEHKYRFTKIKWKKGQTSISLINFFLSPPKKFSGAYSFFFFLTHFFLWILR